MKTVTTNLCPFAVRSGGHMTWPGSNVQGGVTIDLRLLNNIDIDEKRSVAGLGPGSKWKTVYSAMELYNLTAVGGRLPDVGVGGFLLGGGISLLSFRNGFGSDNVVNYEIVLADGTIVNANANSHPDLFWALKLGSTNYGVVTRFDVRMYPLRDVWGGIRTYAVTSKDTPRLLSSWISFAQGEAATREELQGLFIGRWRKSGVDEIATVWHASLDSVPGPSLTDAPIIDDFTRTTSLLDLVNDLQSGDLADTKRNRWHTLTVKLDASFFWDVFNHAKSIFDKLEYISGMHWDLTFQPITRGFLTASSETGGNPFKSVLEESEDDLALIAYLISWKDAADDEVMNQAIRDLGIWSEGVARERGILNRFLYLNYANEEQPVYTRSVSQKDMARMMDVKRRYDAKNTLGRLWIGGFKLPKDEPGTVFESSSRIEL
ncbi:hypothetical protein VKT23_017955 [Stygiomarasmius scandens]|uniref:FAD-binding PCMH-type domain-containing protein n=1 Tax=Marasmiellus scandens TaxID=2682957 RepID=A0ABR1IQM4_9AGAR